MASVNPHTRELVFKLVFYGPGLGGKTTTLQYIHAATRPEHRGKMVSLATPTDRTLYFDFLPVRLPRVRGMAVRLQLFTVPGQVYYAATRKLVLSGADGIVFVADSQAGRMEMNQESLDDLHLNLAEHNRRLAEVPHTFHWNKRDLGDLVAPSELELRFNKLGAPSLGTVATRGDGVFEGLERMTRLVLKAYDADPKVSIEATADAASPAPISFDAVLPIVDGTTPGAGPSRGVEDGVLRVLRGIEAAPEAPTKVSVVLPDTGAPSREAGSVGVVQEISARGVSIAAPSPRLTTSSAPPRAPSSEPRAPGVLSFADLWPHGEREPVRQAEAMLAAHDAVNGILACDVVVTRLLASAAGLVGTLDAPRDPAVVALLLGLDGPRYLGFRTLVRAARHREGVSMRDALEAYAFTLEARRARDLLKQR
jgi:signal recognition particle receptor subunit beta